jgi:NAD(P)-dependent dehydrogenase (short-subunit alcohol dehydrogenase family)
MEITGKTFLITGGGSGLGAATARALVAAGGHAVVVDVNAEAGAAVAAELGASARFAAADVTDETDMRAAIQVAREGFGQLDGAVNCAGVATGERILGKTGPHSLATFSRAIAINLFGTFNVIRLAAEAMQANEPGPSGERGVIVNTASVAAFDGQIGQAAYSASKGGVLVRHIIENQMLNGEVIRLDGAIRMAPR